MSQKAQEAAARRRTVQTVIKDALRHAEEQKRSDGASFWYTEASRMRWVLDVLKHHPMGKRRKA